MGKPVKGQTTRADIQTDRHATLLLLVLLSSSTEIRKIQLLYVYSKANESHEIVINKFDDK